MSYKDQYSITDIETNLKFQRLSLSIEPTGIEGEPDEVMLLAVPNVAEFQHEHFSITPKGLRDLYDWLTEYYKDKDR